MRVRWAKPATCDLDVIEAYIAKDNPVIAIDVVLRVIDKVDVLLSDHPRLGRLGRVDGTRELVIDGLPYVVIYREAIEEVQILRILRDSQQWPSTIE